MPSCRCEKYGSILILSSMLCQCYLLFENNQSLQTPTRLWSGYLQTSAMCLQTKIQYFRYGSMQTASVCKFRHFSQELCLQTPASSLQTTRPPGGCLQTTGQSPAVVCKQPVGVIGGGLQTTGRSPPVVCGFKLTGQPKPGVCKPPLVVCGQLWTVNGGSVMPHVMSLLFGSICLQTTACEVRLFANHWRVCLQTLVSFQKNGNIDVPITWLPLVWQLPYHLILIFNKK